MGKNANGTGNNALGHFKTLGSAVQHQSVFKTNQLTDLSNVPGYATPHIGFKQFFKGWVHTSPVLYKAYIQYFLRKGIPRFT
jgi:hypothetical protein